MPKTTGRKRDSASVVEEGKRSSDDSKTKKKARLSERRRRTFFRPASPSEKEGSSEEKPTKSTKFGRMRMMFKKMKFYQSRDLVKVPWHTAKRMLKTQLNKCLQRYNPADAVALVKMLDSGTEKKDEARKQKWEAKLADKKNKAGGSEEGRNDEIDGSERGFTLNVSKDAATFFQVHCSALINRLLAEANKNTITRGAKTTSEKDLLRAYETLKKNRRLQM